MKEFNWLGECTLCNLDCCHNTNKKVSEYECTKPLAARTHTMPDSYDHRPIECRIFPFDVKEINEKLMWIKWDSCHATPKLNYEQHMDFFEKSFFRNMSLNHIKQYIHERMLNEQDSSTKSNYIVIREINWPSGE